MTPRELFHELIVDMDSYSLSEFPINKEFDSAYSVISVTSKVFWLVVIKMPGRTHSFSVNSLQLPSHAGDCLESLQLYQNAVDRLIADRDFNFIEEVIKIVRLYRGL